MQHVSESLDKYEYVYVFGYDNLRAKVLKDLRATLKDDRFFLGKNKVMALAMGRTPEEEPKENLHKISQYLEGNSGLLFTSRPKIDVIRFFSDFKEDDFARGGMNADQDVVIPAGPLPFQHTMVDQLRKLGLPVMLKNGIVMNEHDHKVCTKGIPLTPEQAHILKLMDMKSCEFKVTLKCVWHDGTFEKL